MTVAKFHSSSVSPIYEGSTFDQEDAEIHILGMLEDSFLFPGAQFFNKIMLGKKAPKKISKSSLQKNLGQQHDELF